MPGNEPRTSMPRWAKITVAILIALVCLYVYQQTAVSHALQAEYARWREMGFPTTLAEFVDRPEPLGKRNAANDYGRAIAAWRKIDRTRDLEAEFSAAYELDLSDPLGAVPDAATMYRSLAQFAKVMEPLVQHVEVARGADYCWFPLEIRGMLTIFSGASDLIVLADQLPYVIIHRAEDGDIDEAIALLGDLMRIIDAVEKIPGGMHVLAGCFVRSFANRTAIWILFRCSLSEGQLSELRDVIQSRIATGAVQQAIAAGGLACAIAMMDGIEGVEEKVSDRIRRACGLLDRQALLVLRSHRQAIEALDAPTQEWAKRLEAIAQPLDGYADFAFLTIPVLVSRVTRSNAETACVAATIDVERYRLAHGGLPHSLDEVDPQPIDPFTGKLLGYHIDTNGYTIFSVGPNGVDDSAKWGNRSEHDDTLVHVPMGGK